MKDQTFSSQIIMQTHFQKLEKWEVIQFFYHSGTLRTMPTIVIAHRFCASRDTQISYGWCLIINTGIFLGGSKLCGESRT